METISPYEALERAIGSAIFAKGARLRSQPGQIVASMSPDVRQALSRLTSRDMSTIRDDVVALWIDEPFGKDLMRNFDRKLRLPSVREPRWT